MSVKEVTKGVYWVGVVDWNRRTFHGHTYTTNRGTTYNAYLIIDEKIALVDTVLGSFSGEMLKRIREVIDPARIDYIIANHVENDHSGALPEIMKLCPKAKLMGSPKCKEGLEKHYFGNWDFNVVKTGDEVKLGKKTLKFIEAPMLHWPDSMFTYIPEDGLLLPNDAFGQHYATSGRFDDEVSEAELMDEAEKYYANILWPFSGLIIRKIEELQKMNVPLNIIAPSHGVIWRKDPGRIIKAYLKWANNTTRDKAVVAYETMWGATETMARLIAEGLSDSGIEVKLYDVVLSDRTEIITTMMDARAFVLGSSTHDNDMLSGMAGFLMFLKGLRPKGRIGFAFGSFGWAGGGAESVEKGMKEAAVELVKPVLTVKYIPDEKEKAACYEYGKELAKMIIERRK